MINPEQSQNPRGDRRPTADNIIAIATEATRSFSKMAKSTFKESSAFFLNHGAGHNSNMNHAGDNNAYDVNGRYQEEAIYVPSGVNVMTNGGDIMRSIQNGKGTLQNYITSPVNRQAGNAKTISIQAMYLRRFGNAVPNSTLPTEP